MSKIMPLGWRSFAAPPYGEIMKQAPSGALTIMDNSQCLITLNKETCNVLRRIGCSLSNVNILYS